MAVIKAGRGHGLARCRSRGRERDSRSCDLRSRRRVGLHRRTIEIQIEELTLYWQESLWAREIPVGRWTVGVRALTCEVGREYFWQSISCISIIKGLDESR